MSRSSTKEDVVPDENELVNAYMDKQYYAGIVKFYI